MVRIEGRVGAVSFISTYQDELRGETKRKKKDNLLFLQGLLVKFLRETECQN